MAINEEDFSNKSESPSNLSIQVLSKAELKYTRQTLRDLNNEIKAKKQLLESINNSVIFTRC